MNCRVEHRDFCGGFLVQRSLAIDAEGQPKRAGRGGFEF